MNRTVVFVMSILLCASVAIAQLPTATILGQVKDASGAVVAGAKITARNTDTGQTRTTTTGDDGAYRIDALPVGNYEISAEKTGFKTEAQTGLTLTVSQQAVENFTIQVGEMSQTVAVTAEAPVISTTTSSLGGLVNDQSMADLPLNGRNYNDLTLLQPGITQAVNANTTSLGLNGTNYSANGAPFRSNTYLLDGALLVNSSEGNAASATGTTLGVDGILEYRVINNNYSAEYGMTMGSIQTIVSKGGTNRFHGDAFEFLRNSDLDARNYFDLPPAKIGHRLPEFRRNNYGGAFGGPIKKDKTFFFGVYEGLSQSLGTTNTVSVFGAGCHGAAGALITLAACPQISPLTSVTIAPQMAPMLALFPLPNIGATQYGYGFTQPTSEDYGQMRVDHTFSSNDTFFARYTIDNATQKAIYGLPIFGYDFASRGQFLTLSENHIISTSLLNTGRFSFSRTKLSQQLDSSAGAASPQYSWVAGQPIGNLVINGLLNTGNSTGGPTVRLQNVFTWSDDLDYTHGRHSLKFGFVFNHFQWFNESAGLLRGQAIFAGVSQFLTGSLAGGQGYSEAPPGSILVRTWHFNTMGFYAQDDWRVTPRLTLNLGMRYEPTTTFAETHGISASLRNYLTDPTTTLGPPFRNPSLRNWSPRFGFAWDVFGDGRTSLRGGFAVLYDQMTLGGAVQIGGSYTPPFDPVFNVAAGTFSVPYVVPANVVATNTYRGPVYFQQQPHLLTYNLTTEHQLTNSLGITLAYAGSRGIDISQDKEGNPTVPNGVPLNGACVAPAAGTLINLASQIDGQATSCYLASAVRRNINWGSLAIITAGADSIYNALEFSVNKRLSRGLQIQSSYTYSKVIDDVQSGHVADGVGPTSVTGADPLHEKTDRGPADFDLTQNWRLNAIYHFPDFTSSKGFLGKLENGWWTSGIFALTSGYPMTVFLGTDRSLDNQIAGTPNPFERPDVVAGRFNSNITSGTSPGCGTGASRAAGGTAIAAGTPLGTQTLWYDPCAFTTQPQGFIGAEGRNYLRGPGYDNLNFSIVKDTAVGFLGEAGKIEFRAEFFNLFNHVNFALPNSAASTAYAGTCGGSILACTATAANPGATAAVIQATQGTSRQIQFGLKIMF